MPVTLELRESGRVLYYTFTDPWEVGELIALYPQSLAYLRGASNTICTLADVRRARRIPSGLLNLRFGPDWSHPNGGPIVVVGASSLLRTFANIVFRLSGFERTKFFDSEAEAWAYVWSVLTGQAEIPVEK